MGATQYQVSPTTVERLDEKERLVPARAWRGIEADQERFNPVD
jgi:hypothetical protein